MSEGSIFATRRSGLGGNRFGPMFAAEIKKEHSAQMRAGTQWCWHLDEVFVRINGRTYYLWRAVNHEGEVLEAYVTKRRDRKAALRFLRKAMQHYGHPEVIVTDRLRSYGAAMREIGDASRQETGRWLNNRAENAHQPLRRRARDGEVQDFEITFRSLLRSTLQATTTSIRNVISSAAKPSSSTALLFWRSGNNLQPEGRDIMAFADRLGLI